MGDSLISTFGPAETMASFMVVMVLRREGGAVENVWQMVNVEWIAQGRVVSLGTRKGRT